MKYTTREWNMPPSFQIKYNSSLCATLCYNLSLLASCK